jgi:predicted secreted protein
MNAMTQINNQSTSRVSERLIDIGNFQFERIIIETDISVVFTQDIDCPKPSGVVEAAPELASMLEVSCNPATKTLTIAGCRGADYNDVRLVLSSVYVKSFTLNGNGLLVIRGIKVSSLNLELNGSGKIVAEGTSNKIKRTIKGNGEIDSSALVEAQLSFSLIQGNGQIIETPGQESTGAIDGNGRILLTSGSHDRIKTKGTGAIQSLTSRVIHGLNRDKPAPYLEQSQSDPMVERVQQLLESVNENDDEPGLTDTTTLSDRRINWFHVFILIGAVAALAGLNYGHL